MIVDHLPTIRAFVEERIRGHIEHPALSARGSIVEELKLILELCEGLQKQSNTLSAAFAEANIPI